MIPNKIPTALKLSKTDRPYDKGSRISVGLKMMIGVGLICVCCMGLLIYVNFQAFARIETETNALLEINAGMNTNLRDGIFDLQKKYLAIPRLLQVNADDDIQAWLRSRFQIQKETIIQGRNHFQSFFNRSERRDLSKGKFIVQATADQVIISKGKLNSNGNFSEQIEQILIKTAQPKTDLQIIRTYISTAVKNVGSADALNQKVTSLKNLLADEAIASETARNAILYQVEAIEKKKADLIVSRQNKLKTVGLVAISTILLNLVLLHFMSWFVIEKPLKRLTYSIDRINAGERVSIPYQTRKDRIGVLSGVLKNFQDVLIRLQNEDLRKKTEQQIIQDLVQNISGMIQNIQMKANTMKKSAIELSSLADMTEEQTDTATASASKTVLQTDMVSDSTHQLQAAVKNISEQIGRQNELVNDINEVTRASRKDIAHLTDASKTISDIVNIVKHIAKESNLLALNARIEAARAGEAGKGFTVVANEVRALSNQTDEANGDIADKVASIQKASQTIIEHTRKIETRIERLTQAGRQISETIEEQSAVTLDIARSAHDTTHDIKDVSTRISQVKNAARTTSRFAGDVRSYSEQVEAQLSDLLDETREKLSKIGISGQKDYIKPENDGSFTKGYNPPFIRKQGSRRTDHKQNAA